MRVGYPSLYPSKSNLTPHHFFRLFNSHLLLFLFFPPSVSRKYFPLEVLIFFNNHRYIQSLLSLSPRPVREYISTPLLHHLERVARYIKSHQNSPHFLTSIYFLSHLTLKNTFRSNFLPSISRSPFLLPIHFVHSFNLT